MLPGGASFLPIRERPPWLPQRIHPFGRPFFGCPYRCLPMLEEATGSRRVVSGPPRLLVHWAFLPCFFWRDLLIRRCDYDPSPLGLWNCLPINVPPSALRLQL